MGLVNEENYETIGYQFQDSICLLDIGNWKKKTIDCLALLVKTLHKPIKDSHTSLSDKIGFETAAASRSKQKPYLTWIANRYATSK